MMTKVRCTWFNNLVEIDKKYTFKPKLNYKIPNYQRLQGNLQKSLETKKSELSPTAPNPFEGMNIHHEQQARRAEKTKEYILAAEAKVMKHEKCNPYTPSAVYVHESLI